MCVETNQRLHVSLIKKEKRKGKEHEYRLNNKREEGWKTRGTERQTQEGDRDEGEEGGGDMVPVQCACNASEQRQRWQTKKSCINTSLCYTHEHKIQPIINPSFQPSHSSGTLKLSPSPNPHFFFFPPPVRPGMSNTAGFICH